MLYQLSYTPMGRLMGIEPMHAGATIQCVNRFTKAAMSFINRTREHVIHEFYPLRQLPTLPRRLQRSTLGLWTLNCCVRNGNRWNRPGIITALLTCPRAKPAGRMRLGNKSYGKVSQESSPKDADDWLTLTALNESCSLKTSQKKL